MTGLFREDLGGNGADGVLVHGWGLNRAVWRGLSGALGRHLHLQAVDLPGHGASPLAAPGIDAWSGRLASAVRTPAVWIAWSLGGLVALRMAQWRPDRVRALVLVGTSPRFARGPEWQWGAAPELLDGFAQRLQGDFRGMLGEFIALNARPADEPGRRALRGLKEAVALAPPTPEGLQQGLDIIRHTDLRDCLADIRLPVLVVNGEHDRLTHPEVAAWVANQLPDAELWRVRGASHAPFLSHPDAFVSRVSAFLRERGAAAA